MLGLCILYTRSSSERVNVDTPLVFFVWLLALFSPPRCAAGLHVLALYSRDVWACHPYLVRSCVLKSDVN